MYELYQSELWTAKLKRMDKILMDCLILTVVVSLVLGGGVYLFGAEILRLYTEEAEVIRCGIEIFAYTTVTYFLCGIMDLFQGHSVVWIVQQYR